MSHADDQSRKPYMSTLIIVGLWVIAIVAGTYAKNGSVEALRRTDIADHAAFVDLATLARHRRLVVISAANDTWCDLPFALDRDDAVV